jgi:2-polyprenyl-3-methyl-5-hydroxy-6-metoxy-1,4-benzoquinol methylase
MNDFFSDNDTKSALEAQYEAQKIAFAPIIFQVARSMRDLGILDVLHAHDKEGLTLLEMANQTTLSRYGIQTLLETALSADIVKLNDDKYRLTKTGYFLLKDPMTRINMNYNHFVNYQGLYHLDEAIKETKAAGLKVFGEWETIYPALSSLPEQAQKSWFEFDHFYSDSAFPEAIEILRQKGAKKLLDVGGNTGKFTTLLAQSIPDIHLTIADLPEQIELARQTIKQHDLEERIDLCPMNILDPSTSLPKGYDIIWMSQFLDCFKRDDIVNILKKAKEAMSEHSRLIIMEPLWDKQRFETSAYCIINTSPYFTAMANGYSKMFHSQDMLECIDEAGISVVESIDHVGICQNILICQKI